MKKSALFVAIVFALFAIPALADVATPTQHETFDFGLSPGSDALTFDQFNMGPGYTLTGVYMKFYIEIGADITGENDSAEISSGLVDAAMSGNASATGLGLAANAVFNAAETTPGPLAASDGTPGSGPDFYDFGFIGDDDTQSDSLNSGLGAFIGAGTFDITVNGSGGYVLTGVSDATLTISDFAAAGYVEIYYTYTENQVPEPTTIIMAGSCLAGMVGIVRRKLKK